MLSLFNGARDTGLRYPSAPEGIVLYAVGDIHGRSDCLWRAQALIDEDFRQRGGIASEIYIGDYVDRGPDTRGVLDLLVARAQTKHTIMLRGNHELVMEAFLRGLTSFDGWLSMGGLEAALSYGVDAPTLIGQKGCFDRRDLAEKLPVSHVRFFSKLQSYHRCGRYFFAHAGVRPGIALENQSIDDLVWIRDEFLDFQGDFGSIIVHGHTPCERIDFRPNRINIDTGAYITSRLSVIRIDASGVSPLKGAILNA